MRATFFAILSLALTGCVTTDWTSGWNFRQDTLSKSGYAYSIVDKSRGHPVRSGEKSLRFEVRPGDCGKSIYWNDCVKYRERSELIQIGFARGEKWYHWSLHIPEEYASVIATGSPMLGQWHYHNPNVYGAGPVPVMFKLMATRIPETNKYDYAYVIDSMFGLTGILATLDDMRGKWTDVLAHAKWTRKDDGFLRVYVNGDTVPVFSYSGSTMIRGYNVFFKFGIYRDRNDKTQVVYYDDVRKGSRCEDVTEYFDCSELEDES